MELCKKKLSQVTQKIGYLQNIVENEESKNQFVLQYLKPLLHSGLGKILKGTKSKGFSGLQIIQFLSLLPLLGLSSIGSIYSSTYSKLVIAQKDVFYRFKNNTHIPWRRLLSSIARRFLRLCEKRKKQSDVVEDEVAASPKCLIFDDTDIEKTGAKIEGVSKIWSHRFHRSILGFKNLVIGFYDGYSFVPIDFSLHREQGKTKKKVEGKKKRFGLKIWIYAKQFFKKRTASQAGAVRKKELDEKKTGVIIQMIQRAWKEGFKADYVLCDSWFFCEDLLKLVVQKGMNLISGVKWGKYILNIMENYILRRLY